MPLRVALAHADHIAEDAAALGGKLHVLVVAPEEPFGIAQFEQDLVEKEV